MTRTQVVIVGAGPIGLELAVALRQAGVDYLHLDAGQVGQTIAWYPNQARFFSSPERIAIAGVPLVTPDQSKATREQYLAYLRGVVQQFDLPIRTYTRVTGIHRDGERFIVRTMSSRGGGDDQPANANHAIEADQVVLAIGDMHRPRRLHIAGEDLDHVSHYFHDPHPYFRQRLLIVGGRNSAVEAALRCHRAGARVAISYRRAGFDESSIKYWLLPELRALIEHEQIEFHPRTVPTQITADRVELADVDGDQPPRREPADFVLLLTGYEQDTTLLEMAGVELEGPNRAPRVDPRTMRTNVPGLYVAGTAVAGTQVRFRLFIENCHPHVTRIVTAITGREPPPALVNQAARRYSLPES